MMISWLTLLCYIVALAATLIMATEAHTAAGPPQICTPPASVECALRTAGVRDPAAMTESLLRAELQTIGDVAELEKLDAMESAELFSELRAAAVPLGDPSRLRKIARMKKVCGLNRPVSFR